MTLLKSKQIPLEFQGLPKKFKKYHKIKYKSLLKTYATNVGGMSLFVTNHTWFTIKQLLSIIKILKPALKEAGRASRAAVDFHVDTILTRKAKDIRMGRGKGAPIDKVSLKRAGSSVYQLYGLQSAGAGRLSYLCLTKLSKGNYINIREW